MKRKTKVITMVLIVVLVIGTAVLWHVKQDTLVGTPIVKQDEVQGDIIETQETMGEIETDSDAVIENSSLAEESEEPTPPPHEHSYTETTTPATCTENGHTKYICDCGDTYTVEIEATGHSFEDYVYNNDATYLADGTQTATCTCGEQDTIAAEGTKLQYTFTSLDKTMYTVEGSNLRSMPCNDGEKIARINERTAVAVTGVCNETGWYRINHNGQELYTLSSNLADELPELVYTNEYPMDEYGNRIDPYADGFNPYHRPGYVWIHGFGYIATGGTEGTIVDGGTEAFDGQSFWDIMLDPNNKQVGY